MMEFDFKIRDKKGSKMPADFLLRIFIKNGSISALDVNWAHTQSKDNLSNIIKESLKKDEENFFQSSLELKQS